MDLRHMRHFVAVAEELHFGRAARRLHMAQPPLSQSIRRLEADLGVELLKRSRRGVDLTDVGRTFLVHARRTLMQADLAQRTARRSSEKAAEVRLSFMNAALYRLLPQLVLRFRKERPDINLRLFERPSPDQVDAILSGDFDLGMILHGTPKIENLERMVIERAPLVAAVPAAGPLGNRSEITLRELAEQPFIRPPEPFGRRLSEPVAIFEAVGIVPNVVQEATQMNTMLSLVGSGLGCAIVTSTAMRMHIDGVQFLRIVDPAPTRHWQLELVWNPDHLDPAANVFVQMVRRHLAENPSVLDANHYVA